MVLIKGSVFDLLLCEVDEDIIDIIYKIDWLINATSPEYFVSICVVLGVGFPISDAMRCSSVDYDIMY